MKHLLLFYVTAIFIISPVANVQAQNIDDARMNDDLIVAENILHEMFKTRWEAHGNTVGLTSGSSFGRNNHAIANYLPGYGVILNIPGGPPAIVTFTNAQGETSSYSFQNNDGKNKKVTKQAIINKMKTFLSDYGSTIGQLKNNDKITVIYQHHSPRHPVQIHTFSSINGKKDETKASALSKIPSSITVTARKTDLKALRKESISKKTFYNRLDIRTAKKGSERRDLNIMTKILKSSFKKSDQTFHVEDPVNQIYIKGLGAIFYLNASYGSGFDGINATLTHLHNKLVKIINNDTLKAQVLRVDTAKGQVFKPDTVIWNKPHPDTIFVSNFFDSNNDSIKNNRHKKILEAYQQFLNQLKETMVNYGRTLKSVKKDELIYLSVSLPSQYRRIPDRVELQIRKSVLRHLDQGKVNRENAMDEIKTKEYSFY